MLQTPPGREPTVPPTPAQRVVTAMWQLDAPATTTDIATAATLDAAATIPVVEHLRATGQAVMVDTTDGCIRWLLTASLPQGRAPHSMITGVVPPLAEPAAPAQNEQADTGETADTDSAESDCGGGGQPPVGSDPDSVKDCDATAVEAADGTGAAGTGSVARPYRKPTKPRRPHGELRAAVLAVLTGSPERTFKVSEVCNAINTASGASPANKAGGGAVANALDRLVTRGEAIRIEDTTVATYQAAP